ncbi:1701_t:CDS:2 [Paraglomus occultum]|uniref:1701_t:CDS:1 n=1 Tax=Paraglomus occultum TaxID=144539 RepID=A0A9N9FYU6_9GLOM|nr:1701_t:CDS:2 [Paraglomus occultum]
MATPLLFVRALYDFSSSDPTALTFNKDDIIQVLSQSDNGWWEGLHNGMQGGFPSRFVAVVSDIESYSSSVNYPRSNARCPPYPGRPSHHISHSSISSTDIPLPPTFGRQRGDGPSYLDYDYHPSEIVFSFEGSVKGASLNALIELLTVHDVHDSNITLTFLLTYRTFTTTKEFLELLMKRFMISSPYGLTAEELEVWQEKKQTPIRLRVFNIMKTWLGHHYRDSEDLECLAQLQDFVRNVMLTHMKVAGNCLLQMIERKQKQPKDNFKDLVPNDSIQPPPPILPRKMKNLEFLEIEPIELARQLTLIDSHFFGQIGSYEWMRRVWQKNDDSRSISVMINFSNQIAFWTVGSILQQQEPKVRGNWIKHYIAVADACWQLNNLNSMAAIVMALNSAPIHRLKKTWEHVNSKSVQTLEKLTQSVAPSRNFVRYREKLHSVNPPVVPFLAVHLTDLDFIAGSSPDLLKKTNLINFSKRVKVAEIVRQMTSYQNVTYRLNRVPSIETFIRDQISSQKNITDLYEVSLRVEALDT